MPFLGMMAGLALRFPKTAKFLGSYGKYLLGAAVVVGVYFAGAAYLHHRDNTNYQRGFGVAEKQAQELVRKANEREAEKQKALDLITQRFGFLAQQREGQVTTIVQPQIERITHEVQSNPVYRQCAIADRVRIDINSVIAAVNASIGADAPVESR